VAAPVLDPLRLSRQVYVLRILGLTLGSIAVAAVFYENAAPQPAWTGLIVSSLAWPHAAWLLARRSADPHRVERTSLTLDSALGGFWIAIMHFNLLPSVLIAAMMSMDKIGWGPRFLVRTSLAMAGACLGGAVLTGFAYSPATDMPVIVASLPLMFGYPIAVAFAAYESGRIARLRTQQTAELREQLAHIARVGTLGEMAAGLAHELNQPLTAIHFEAAAVLEMSDEEAIPAMRDALTSIAEQSLRAGAIVRGMRTFARRAEEKRELVDIRQLIDEVLALLAHDLRLNNVETITALNDVPDVIVDRIEMQQVLVNLIRNAIEAMTAGDTVHRRLTIETRPVDSRARVSVIDTGPGVDPELVPTLFHPFRSNKPTGLGLGLSICQTLVEAHRGRIGMTARPGSGTEFFFELPAAS
jgi:signal transduction histidine kinase